MNNEIKEILEFKEDADYKRLSVGEIIVLRDYITNLQDRIDKTIEYINTHYVNGDDLLDILKGEENE